jgi:hypothetical protein
MVVRRRFDPRQPNLAGQPRLRGESLAFPRQALSDLNRRSIELLGKVRYSIESDATRGVISGCIGPRADGYIPSNLMSTEEAQTTI